jgi:hypothetical protein
MDMGLVKIGTRRALKRVLLETGEPNMDAWDLTQHLEKVWYERATEKTICAGFQSCGIHPLNMNWIHEHASLFDTSISSMNALDDEITLRSISIFGTTAIVSYFCRFAFCDVKAWRR